MNINYVGAFFILKKTMTTSGYKADKISENDTTVITNYPDNSSFLSDSELDAILSAGKIDHNGNHEPLVSEDELNSLLLTDKKDTTPSKHDRLLSDDELDAILSGGKIESLSSSKGFDIKSESPKKNEKEYAYDDVFDTAEVVSEQNTTRGVIEKNQIKNSKQDIATEKYEIKTEFQPSNGKPEHEDLTLNVNHKQLNNEGDEIYVKQEKFVEAPVISSEFENYVNIEPLEEAHVDHSVSTSAHNNLYDFTDGVNYMNHNTSAMMDHVTNETAKKPEAIKIDSPANEYETTANEGKQTERQLDDTNKRSSDVIYEEINVNRDVGKKEASKQTDKSKEMAKHDKKADAKKEKKSFFGFGKKKDKEKTGEKAQTQTQPQGSKKPVTLPPPPPIPQPSSSQKSEDFRDSGVYASVDYNRAVYDRVDQHATGEESTTHNNETDNPQIYDDIVIDRAIKKDNKDEEIEQTDNFHSSINNAALSHPSNEQSFASVVNKKNLDDKSESIQQKQSELSLPELPVVHSETHFSKSSNDEASVSPFDKLHHPIKENGISFEHIGDQTNYSNIKVDEPEVTKAELLNNDYEVPLKEVSQVEHADLQSDNDKKQPKINSTKEEISVKKETAEIENTRQTSKPQERIKDNKKADPKKEKKSLFTFGKKKDKTGDKAADKTNEKTGNQAGDNIEQQQAYKTAEVTPPSQKSEEIHNRSIEVNLDINKTASKANFNTKEETKVRTPLNTGGNTPKTSLDATEEIPIRPNNYTSFQHELYSETEVSTLLATKQDNDIEPEETITTQVVRGAEHTPRPNEQSRTSSASDDNQTAAYELHNGKGYSDQNNKSDDTLPVWRRDGLLLNTEENEAIKPPESPLPEYRLSAHSDALLEASRKKEVDVDIGNRTTDDSDASETHEVPKLDTKFYRGKGPPIDLYETADEKVLEMQRACRRNDSKYVKKNIAPGLFNFIPPKIERRDWTRERDNHGRTVLHIACQKNSTKAATIIIQKFKSLICRLEDKDGRTPLHAAAASKANNILEEILKTGVQADQGDVDGCTPLHLACFYNGPSTAKILLEYSADRDALDYGGRHALHYACYNNAVKAAQYLIDIGVKVDIKDNDGSTPLHHACYGKAVQAVGVLLTRQAFVEVRDVRGNTPLHEAAKQNSENIVRLLLAAGANTESYDNEGNRPADLTQDKFILQLLHGDKDFDHYIDLTDGKTPVTNTLTHIEMLKKENQVRERTETKEAIALQTDIEGRDQTIAIEDKQNIRPLMNGKAHMPAIMDAKSAENYDGLMKERLSRKEKGWRKWFHDWLDESSNTNREEEYKRTVDYEKYLLSDRRHVSDEQPPPASSPMVASSAVPITESLYINTTENGLLKILNFKSQ